MTIVCCPTDVIIPASSTSQTQTTTRQNSNIYNNNIELAPTVIHIDRSNSSHLNPPAPILSVSQKTVLYGAKNDDSQNNVFKNTKKYDKKDDIHSPDLVSLSETSSDSFANSNELQIPSAVSGKSFEVEPREKDPSIFNFVCYFLNTSPYSNPSLSVVDNACVPDVIPRTMTTTIPITMSEIDTLDTAVAIEEEGDEEVKEEEKEQTDEDKAHLTKAEEALDEKRIQRELLAKEILEEEQDMLITMEMEREVAREIAGLTSEEEGVSTLGTSPLEQVTASPLDERGNSKLIGSISSEDSEAFTCSVYSGFSDTETDGDSEESEDGAFSVADYFFGGSKVWKGSD